MSDRKLNVSTVNYTTEDKKTLLKRMILEEWVKRNHPGIIVKVDKYVDAEIEEGNDRT